MAYTQPKTWLVSERSTAADLNTHLRDNQNALASGRSSIRLRLTGGQSISNTAEQIVNWAVSATTDWQVGTLWASASGGKIVPDQAGVWRIDLTMDWGAVTSGSRMMAVRFDGSTLLQLPYFWTSAPGTSGTIFATGQLTGVLTGTECFVLSTNDYFQVIAYQNTGAAIEIQGGSSLNPRTAVTFSLVSTATTTATSS